MRNDNHPAAGPSGTPAPEGDRFIPTPERPWPPATGQGGRVYDHGIYWCDRRSYHPDAHDGYPHPDHYLSECRSHPGLLSTGRLDYAGQPADVEIYAARPFAYGQPRERLAAGELSQTRLVLAAIPLADDHPAVRFSLPITEVRNLARHLLHVADVIDGYIPPWKPGQAV